MNIQIEHIRHQSAAEIRAGAMAARKRILAAGQPAKTGNQAPKARQAKSAPVAVVFLPLWKVQETEFDHHVSAFRDRKTPHDTTKEFIRTRAQELRFSYADIVGDRRFRGLVAARQQIIAEVREAFPHLSLPQIGRCFGNRDHTTILSSIRRVASGSVTAPSSMSEAQIQAIKDDIDKRVPRKQICMKYNLAAPTLRYLIEKRGWEPKVPRTVSPLRTKIDRLKELFDAGHTYAVISEEMGVGQKRISSFIKKLGWKRHRLGEAMRALDKDQVKSLFDDGMSFRRMAETLGIAKNTAIEFCKLHGWTRDQSIVLANTRRKSRP